MSAICPTESNSARTAFMSKAVGVELSTVFEKSVVSFKLLMDCSLTDCEPKNPGNDLLFPCWDWIVVIFSLLFEFVTGFFNKSCVCSFFFPSGLMYWTTPFARTGPPS